MKKITSEIKKVLLKKTKSLGKDISWFKFAKKTKNGGWRFLNNKENQWDILEEIAKEIKKTNKKYTTGQITDMIAEIVNS